MKRIILSVPFVLLLLAVTAFSAAAAPKAGPPPIQGYHIENQMLHCIIRFMPCSTVTTAPNSLYTNVEVDKFAKGVTRGRPDLVNLVCGYAYFDQHNTVHYVGPRVTVAVGLAPGRITGNAYLAGDYSLKSREAIAVIDHVTAYDAMTRDTAYVNGKMVINNVTHLRVSGGFDLTLIGPIYDLTMDASGKEHVTVVGYGRVSCNSSASYVKAPFATGPYFIATNSNPPGPEATR